MKRWLPCVTFPGFCMSDGWGEDVEGVSISIEWFGVVAECAVGRRGRPERQCIVCDKRSNDATTITVDAPGGPLDAAMCRQCAALAAEVIDAERPTRREWVNLCLVVIAAYAATFGLVSLLASFGISPS